MTKNVLLLVIGLTAVASVFWFLSQPSLYTTPGEDQVLASELNSLDSVDLDSQDRELKNLDSESSTF